MHKILGLSNVKIIAHPYQSEKFAASLPQTCSTLFSAPEKLRNSVQKCAASGTLLAHNRLCARTGIVCDKCATIYSYSKQALIVCQKCARGFSLYFYSVKVSRVCQNSMMIFLVYLCVLKSVCELGLCSVERRKYMRRSHFFTQREKLGFVQASILFQLYMNVYYMGIFRLYYWTMPVQIFCIFTSEWCLARNSSYHNVKWAIPFHEWPPPLKKT